MFLTLRLALRQLLKTPGFTATALLTLAICIGANLAIFAVVDAVLVRPLPFPEPDRLVAVVNAYPGAGVPRAGASIPNYFDRKRDMKAFSSLALCSWASVTVGDAGSPVRVETARITPEFFATLGVHLAMGKEFTEANLAYGPDQVAILTDGYWRAHFAADPNVIGRTFLNDGLSVTVVGVLPPGFHFLGSKAEFYRPIGQFPTDRNADRRHNNNSQMYARLAPGVTLASAQEQMNAYTQVQLKDDPLANIIKGSGFRTDVFSLHDDFVREAKPALVLLQAGSLLLLVIGGVNLVNLLLIRATGRTKELAVRQALGAGRMHVVRDIVVETFVISLAGGICGCVLGAFAIDLLRSLGTDKIPLGADIAFNGSVALASIALAVVGSLFLAAPVIWYHLGSRMTFGLQADSRGGTASRGVQTLRSGFIVAQIALAFVLLSAAGLLGVSLKNVLETPSGFVSDNVLTGNILLPWKNYKDDASRLAFVERLLPALKALPGVTQVAISSGLPFSGGTNDSAVTVEGHIPKPGETLMAHYLSDTTGDYWPLMRIPLLNGRLLTEDDSHNKHRVCVVDKAFADRYWPGKDALGRRLAADVKVTNENAFTVVGVVASVKQNDLTENAGHGAIYFPYSNSYSAFFAVAVRSTLPTAAMAPMLQKAVLALDPELPVDDMKPMQARIDETLVARKSPAILAGIFAGVALLLAAIGTYGVLSYSVAQRRREIGVRMAIGAQSSQVRNQFLSSGLKLTVLGSVIGVLGAWAAGHAMKAVLFGVPALHVLSLALTALIINAVAVLACLLPAHRASRINPIDALRAD